MDISDLMPADKTLDSLFESNAMKNKQSLPYIPFSTDTKGDFIYLSNRKIKRYSYLFDELTDSDVHNNSTLPLGYTALLICEKLEYIENANYTYPIFNEKKRPEHRNLVNKYCIFQNPLYNLSEHDFDDILEISDDYDKAYTLFQSLGSEKSVLLARIKAHLDWH